MKGEPVNMDGRVSACRSHMLLSQTFNVIGLALDIFGFLILFVLALPAVMNRNFVSSDRVGLDSVQMNSDQVEQLMDPKNASLLEQRRRRRQARSYWAGGLMVLFGFTLQLVALFLP